MTFPSRLVSGTHMPYQQAVEIIGSVATAVTGAVGTTSLTSTQLTDSLVVVASNAANGQVTLVACEKGAFVAIENRSANPVTIYGRGTNTIGANARVSLSISCCIVLFGTGTDWMYISANRDAGTVP